MALHTEGLHRIVIPVEPVPTNGISSSGMPVISASFFIP
jgi:hypothetical protein